MKKCVICGGRCKCKKAPSGLCCACHKHKVIRVKHYVCLPEMGVDPDLFEAALVWHMASAMQRTFAFEGSNE